MTRLIWMVIALFALFAVGLLAACSESGGGPAGTYELDKDGMMARFESTSETTMDSAQMAMAKTMISGLNMTLTLNPDGTAEAEMSMMGQTESKNGTWSQKGDQLTLAFDEEPKTVKWDGDRIEVSEANGPNIVLKKKP